MASKASAVWTGSLKEGKGTISTATGVLKDANYSFATRFEGADSGTTPEELIAAFQAPPRKSSTRPLQTPRPAAPSPSSSPTTPRLR